MNESFEERIRFANEEIIGKGNIAIVDETFATDFVIHFGGKDTKGLEVVRSFIKQLHSAMSDIQVVEVIFLNQTSDTISWQRTLSGTHDAEWKGIPASGQKVEWRDMLVTRYDGDKIAEEWVVSDLVGQLLLAQPHS